MQPCRQAGGGGVARTAWLLSGRLLATGWHWWQVRGAWRCRDGGFLAELPCGTVCSTVPRRRALFRETHACGNDAFSAYFEKGAIDPHGGRLPGRDGRCHVVTAADHERISKSYLDHLHASGCDDHVPSIWVQPERTRCRHSLADARLRLQIRRPWPLALYKLHCSTRPHCRSVGSLGASLSPPRCTM